MSDFKAKMHQSRFPMGELTALPDPLAVIKGPTSRGREGEWGGSGRKGRGEGKERVGEGKGEEGCPPPVGESGSGSGGGEGREDGQGGELGLGRPGTSFFFLL